MFASFGFRETANSSTTNTPSALEAGSKSHDTSGDDVVSVNHAELARSRATTSKPMTAKQLARRSFYILLQCLRYPYFGLYGHYVRKPTVVLRDLLASKPIESNLDEVRDCLDRWKAKIFEQVLIVQISCTLVATADIAALAWPSLDKTPYPWVTCAFLYSSLALSISSILLSLQQQAHLKSFVLSRPIDPRLCPRCTTCTNHPPSPGIATRDEQETAAQVKRTKEMIDLVLLRHETEVSETSSYELDNARLYVWQTPVMMMSYAVLLFALGISFHAIHPIFFIRKRGWTPEARTALMYIFFAAFAFTNFCASSFLINCRLVKK